MYRNELIEKILLIDCNSFIMNNNSYNIHPYSDLSTLLDFKNIRDGFSISVNGFIFQTIYYDIFQYDELLSPPLYLHPKHVAQFYIDLELMLIVKLRNNKIDQFLL